MSCICDNCNNKKADSIKFNTVEIKQMEIIKKLVNGRDLTHEEIGKIVFSFFFEEY